MYTVLDSEHGKGGRVPFWDIKLQLGDIGSSVLATPMHTQGSLNPRCNIHTEMFTLRCITEEGPHWFYGPRTIRMLALDCQMWNEWQGVERRSCEQGLRVPRAIHWIHTQVASAVSRVHYGTAGLSGTPIVHNKCLLQLSLPLDPPLPAGPAPIHMGGDRNSQSSHTWRT